ncbi:MAG: tannase/feruloyl esterase family alpha/beta hydrolase [Acidobacteriia bacterium]|nr:tannase/feruloyl esterase family alpha/beta hydrolase [Terriglobia bacterium]
MKCRVVLSAFLICLFALVLFPGRLAAQRSCESLTTLALTNATVMSAVSVPTGGFKPPAAPGQAAPNVDLPAFCRVAGVARPTSDSEIKFEVWLPATGWNGKFEQVGNGGFAGTIPLSAMALPLLRGYATAGTDDGHAASMDNSWAIGHPEKVADFGYRAVHETSVQAKAILDAFYGKDLARSYFVGCSDGGREGLMEAQRFPEDFIGIVAGAPANAWTHLQFAGVWNERALHETPASSIPPSKLPVLQNAAVAACDALDGVKDGLIGNPARCHFDPAVTQCKDADAPNCLTAPQVEAARKIYRGARNPRTGAQIFPGYAMGAEAVPANWLIWMTGVGPGQATIGSTFANSFFADFVFENPKWDFRTLNFDSDVKMADAKFASVLDSTNPNMTPFKTRGGKLIQYHGWGDAAIAPQSSVDYYESVLAKTGKRTQDFYRLFMVPGMSHCAGGLGANDFGNGVPVPHADATNDVVLALDRWVEQGVAPDQIIATGFVDGNPAKGVAMTRPLCPYPKEAHYKGAGDTNVAANFVCRMPAKGSKK